MGAFLRTALVILDTHTASQIAVFGGFDGDKFRRRQSAVKNGSGKLRFAAETDWRQSTFRKQPEESRNILKMMKEGAHLCETSIRDKDCRLCRCYIDMIQ